VSGDARSMSAHHLIAVAIIGDQWAGQGIGGEV
jgi:hypothetical protein